MSVLQRDCREVRLLESRMAATGDRIKALEGIVARRGRAATTTLGRIETLLDEQDRINDRLYRILSRYRVDYSGRGFFTVSDGVETVRFDAPAGER